MTRDLQARAAAGRSVVLTGVLLNLCLSAAKITGGILGRSNALIADGVESLLDLISSMLIWVALKYAAKPPDEDHPYGHGKAESLASLLGAIVLTTAGAFIAHNSVVQLIALAHGEVHHRPSPFTLIILIAVITLKETLYQVMVRRARKIGSNALLADAWHHRSDAVTSIAAFIGISISLIGGHGYEAADNWAALFACIVIFYSAYNTLQISLGEMMDARVSGDAEAMILAVACSVPGVLSAEKCRVRKSGLAYLADIHIRVNADISVRDGHDISHQVKDQLMANALPLEDVTVHIEPEQ